MICEFESPYSTQSFDAQNGVGDADRSEAVLKCPDHIYQKKYIQNKLFLVL